MTTVVFLFQRHSAAFKMDRCSEPWHNGLTWFFMKFAGCKTVITLFKRPALTVGLAPEPDTQRFGFCPWETWLKAISLIDKLWGWLVSAPQSALLLKHRCFGPLNRDVSCPLQPNKSKVVFLQLDVTCWQVSVWVWQTEEILALH